MTFRLALILLLSMGSSMASSLLAPRMVSTETIYEPIVCTRDDKAACEQMQEDCVGKCFDTKQPGEERVTCLKEVCRGVLDVCLTGKTCQGVGVEPSNPVRIPHPNYQDHLDYKPSFGN